MKAGGHNDFKMFDNQSKDDDNRRHKNNISTDISPSQKFRQNMRASWV